MPRPLWLPCRGPARARAPTEIPGNETDLELTKRLVDAADGGTELIGGRGGWNPGSTRTGGQRRQPSRMTTQEVH